MRIYTFFQIITLLFISADITAHTVLLTEDNIYQLTISEQESIVEKHPHSLSLSKPWLDEHHMAWKDLDMDLLIATLDRTKSIAGKRAFREFIKPLSDSTELEQRRATFESFLYNDQQYIAGEKAILEYSKRESLFFLLASIHPEMKKYLEKLQWLYSEYQQNASATSKAALVFNRPSSLGGGGDARYLQATSFPIVLLMGIVSLSSLKDAFLHVVTPNAQRQNLRDYALPLGKLVWSGLITSTTLLIGTHQTWLSFLDLNRSMRILHGLMINLAEIIANVERDEQMVPNECAPFHAALHEWKQSLDQNSPSYCKDLAALVELLKNSNFTGTPSANIWTSLNMVFEAYEHFSLCSDKLTPIMNAYGSLDAYLATVRLYNEYADSPLPLTWVTLDTTPATPYHVFENLYNPLVSPNAAIPNSFDLGGNNIAHHIVLTGPHGCGKTTAMKSTAYGYIMGQSLLLVPASKGIIKPLTGMGTYMNITDKLSEGISSFMAEKQRMKQLYSLAKNCTDDDVYLFLIDEPYAKTLQVVGEQLVYEFIDELRNIPQLMILFATHFEKPAILEQESHGHVANYQPELLEPTPGNFVRTFKILNGKAAWWFDDARRRRSFVDWLGEGELY